MDNDGAVSNPLTTTSKFLRFALLGCLGLLSLPGHADSVYRCRESGGKVTYLDAPCADVGNTGTESVLKLPYNPPAIASSAVKLAAKSNKAKVAEIRLFYDPTNAPIEHPLAQMETLIRNATRAWSANCMVHLLYVGTAPAPAVGRVEKVGIRWAEQYIHAQHPSYSGAGIAGTGSMPDGIRLSTRMTDDYLPRVLVHEIGHVLGLSHNHEDGRSVMSYLPSKDRPNNVQPSESDYQACNLSMKNHFDIDVDVADAPKTPGRKMSDRDALQRIYSPASAPRQ